MASEAMIFMLVAVNDHFRLPVEYFLITTLNSSQRAEMVRQCLSLTHETGAVVVSLTCDGLAANISTIEMLGGALAAQQLEKVVPSSRNESESPCDFGRGAHAQTGAQRLR